MLGTLSATASTDTKSDHLKNMKIPKPTRKKPELLNIGDKFSIYGYVDNKKQWRWFAQSHKNYKILANGAGDGYKNRGDMLKILGVLFPG